jgi:hypothetical protein
MTIMSPPKPTIAFTDISVELWREYVFPDGQIVRIENPTGLNVSKSGGHRLTDAQGMGHYVPAGWRHLRWLPKPGEPIFVA